VATLSINTHFQGLSILYGELQFEEEIGRGTFGQVYRGWWNEKEVALKKISVPAGEDKYKMITSSPEISALKWV